MEIRAAAREKPDPMRRNEPELRADILGARVRAQAIGAAPSIFSIPFDPT